MIKSGKDFGREKKYEQARAHFLNVLCFKTGFDVFGNLAVTAKKQEHWPEALAAATESLAATPLVIDDRAKHDKRVRMLEQLREHGMKSVVSLKIDCNVEDAIVTVDGRVLGKTPRVSVVYVDAARRHEVKVTATGYRDSVVVIEEQAGTKKPIKIVLHVTQTPPPNGNGQQSTGANPVMLGIGYGIAAVALGVGGALVGVGSGKQSDAEALQQQLDASGGCGAPPCVELTTAFGEADTSYNSGAWLLIGGGVAAVVTTVYLVVGGSSASSGRIPFMVTPWVADRSGGIGASGSF